MKKESQSKKLASDIRQKAQSLKDNKSAIAEVALSKACRAADWIKSNGDLMKTLGNAASVTGSAFMGMASNKPIRKMSLSLVENTLNSFVDRLNEFATLVEAAGKDPEVTESFDLIKVALKKVQAVSDKLAEKFGDKFVQDVGRPKDRPASDCLHCGHTTTDYIKAEGGVVCMECAPGTLIKESL